MPQQIDGKTNDGKCCNEGDGDIEQGHGLEFCQSEAAEPSENEQHQRCDHAVGATSANFGQTRLEMVWQLVLQHAREEPSEQCNKYERTKLEYAVA
jgi:hypothetical protein